MRGHLWAEGRALDSQSWYGRDLKEQRKERGGSRQRRRNGWGKGEGTVVAAPLLCANNLPPISECPWDPTRGAALFPFKEMESQRGGCLSRS